MPPNYDYVININIIKATIYISTTNNNNNNNRYRIYNFEPQKSDSAGIRSLDHLPHQNSMLTVNLILRHKSVKYGSVINRYKLIYLPDVHFWVPK